MPDDRESVLHDAIMNLIRADLDRPRPTTLADLPTFQLVHAIMRSANTDLTAALDIRVDDKIYFSDSVYDEIRNPIYTLALARDAMSALFDESDDVLTVIDELITSILIDLDDILDDDDLVPASLDDLISALTD